MTATRSFTHLFGFYLFYWLSWPMMRLPLRVLYLFSDLFFMIVYYFPGYRKKIVFNNLRNSFPEKNELEIRQTARSFYRHLCDSFIESFASISMSENELRKRCVWKNPELLDHYYRNGRSVVSVFGHYCNWEWMSTLPLYTNFKVLALYKPLANKYFDRFIKLQRERFGIRTIPVIRSFPVIKEYHELKIPVITFFMGDQRPIKKHIRYWTKFLHQDTPVLLGTEQIAKRFGQAVVFFSMNKIKRGYYEIEIIPVYEDSESAGQYEITETHIRLLEAQINRRPEHWLWSHKRWKHKMETAL
jgi:Kdo2-lipid IVA lauroyltransferase/acyltransferase